MKFSNITKILSVVFVTLTIVAGAVFATSNNLASNTKKADAYSFSTKFIVSNCMVGSTIYSLINAELIDFGTNYCAPTNPKAIQIERQVLDIMSGKYLNIASCYEIGTPGVYNAVVRANVSDVQTKNNCVEAGTANPNHRPALEGVKHYDLTYNASTLYLYNCVANTTPAGSYYDNINRFSTDSSRFTPNSCGGDQYRRTANPISSISLGGRKGLADWQLLNRPQPPVVTTPPVVPPVVVTPPVTIKPVICPTNPNSPCPITQDIVCPTNYNCSGVIKHNPSGSNDTEYQVGSRKVRVYTKLIGDRVGQVISGNYAICIRVSSSNSDIEFIGADSKDLISNSLEKCTKAYQTKIGYKNSINPQLSTKCPTTFTCSQPIDQNTKITFGNNIDIIVSRSVNQTTNKEQICANNYTANGKQNFNVFLASSEQSIIFGDSNCVEGTQAIVGIGRNTSAIINLPIQPLVRGGLSAY
jgi:hypothetical protein